MKISRSHKILLPAPAVAQTLAKAETPFILYPTNARRPLFTLVANTVIAGPRFDQSVVRGRWDSACAAAREFFTPLHPDIQKPAPTAIQLELHFA